MILSVIEYKNKTPVIARSIIKTPSLRGGMTRQPVRYYGRFMRLPRRGAPRNDGVLNLKELQP